MEYKQLDGFPEIEANEDGEVRWFKSKQPVTIYYSSSRDGHYIKFRDYNATVRKAWGSDKSISMFNLVARLFIPNPNNCKFVQAIDGNNSNYRASNLEWVKQRRRRVKFDDDE